MGFAVVSLLCVRGEKRGGEGDRQKRAGWILFI